MRARARILPPARTTLIPRPNCPKCGCILHVQIVVHGEYDGIEDNTWSEEHFNCECGFNLPRSEWQEYRKTMLGEERCEKS